MSAPDLEPIKARDEPYPQGLLDGWAELAIRYPLGMVAERTIIDRRLLLAEVERLTDLCERLLAREVTAWDEGYSAGFHDVGYGDTANPILPFAEPLDSGAS